MTSGDALPPGVYADASAGDPLALTRALVAVPSVNPDLEAGGAGEGAAADLCRDWLEAWGFEVTRREPEPGRVSLLARTGRGRDGAGRLVLNGHLDTVGVRGMEAPFDPVVRDGRLHGRGSCDMKGGVAALLSAARAVAERGVEGELLVALTADEEYASVGLLDLVEEGLEADAALVLEPTSLAIMPAHKGFQWVELDFRGRAAHGSRPDLGVDAIRQAGRFLALLDDYEAELAGRPAHPLVGHASVHAGTIEGGGAPSVYPDHCHLLVERRTLPGEETPAVRAEMEALAERLPGGEGHAGVTIRDGLYRPGSETDLEREPVPSLRRALKAEGVEPRVEGMSAWVETAYFQRAGIPAVTFGPGSIDRAHTVDEWVPVDEILTAARVLERVAGAFTGPGASAGP